MTDDALQEAFAALRHDAVARTDIEAAIARRDAERRVRRRRAGRLALAGAAGAVAVAVGLAALPSERADRTAGLSAARVLHTAAAAAADQPAPAPFTGFRYVKTVDRWTYGTSAALVTIERPEEQWLAADGTGTRAGGRGRVVRRSGDRAAADAITRMLSTPLLEPRRDRLGRPPDRIPLRRLPTDPDRLRALLEAALRDGRWREGHARFEPLGPHADEIVRYTLARQVVVLLSSANASPQLRAALFGVLARIEGFTGLGRVRDPLGREGDGVAIRFSPEANPPDTPASGANAEQPETLRVIFDRESGDILSWSIERRLRLAPASPATAREVPDLLTQSHTYVATGQVDRDGERPD